MNDFAINRATSARILLLAFFLLSCSAAGAETIGGSIVILDYELEDVMAPGSGGKAPGSEEVGRRTQWLSEYMRKQIATSQRYTLLPIQNVSAEYEKLKNSTGVIHRCGSCVVDFGKAVGAEYVLLGWVQRFSNLIIKFHLEIIETRTAKVVDRSSIDIRGNTDKSWRDGAGYLIRQMSIGL
jgi:hypothetical protein